MKKLLNTLYVTRQDVYLRQEGEAVVVEKDGSVILRLPIHTLSGVVTFGRVMVSPYLMNLCAERGVCLSMLTEHGKFLARVEGPVSGNVLLRMAQLRVHDQAERKCDLARSFLIGKVVNTRSVLMRRVRGHGATPSLAAAIERQTETLATLREGGRSVASLRGLEGEAAAAYFAAFNDLLVAQREQFAISSRNRRPPTDPTNSLLSYAYTLLAHECRGALESVGLDPQVGFLHEVRSGRPALALDLMEEFRSVIADRAVLSLINLKQVGPRDFKTSESGAVTLSDGARKTFLAVWQKRKQEVITHPFSHGEFACRTRSLSATLIGRSGLPSRGVLSLFVIPILTVCGITISATTIRRMLSILVQNQLLTLKWIRLLYSYPRTSSLQRIPVRFAGLSDL